ncbi:MAG: class I SAM-dependent RNA methyltransferase [Pseudomonadota bacterium]
MRLTIERLGHRGDGVAAGPVYVPRTLPGEVVEGDVTGDRLPAPRIVTPTADRVAPPCPHFKRCGGCALQHASDDFVARWKADRVRRAFADRGIAAEIAGVETSPPSSRRRAALKGRKTKKGAVVGLHAAATHDLIAIPDCRLLHPDLMAALPALERVTRLAAPRGGEVGLHITRSAAGIDLLVSEAKPLDPASLPALAAEGFARVTWNGEAALLDSRPVQRMGRADILPPPGAFMQATAEGEAALAARIRETLGPARRVADLFAGCGTFTFPAAETASVTAWEGARDLTEALEAAARHATGLKPIRAITRDLFRDPVTADELAPFDAAIIDPPRAGAAAQVTEMARADLDRIAFVSCDPDTFARDAGMLVQAGWRMEPITVVDQFRWSPHIELVTAFART